MAWLKVTTMSGIFVLSLLATTFPTISKQSTVLDVPETLFFILKHFGTGVILSTAFVHLLQDAFKILLKLPEGHPVRHWIGLIVLASLLAIFLIEYLSLAYVERLEENCKTAVDEEQYHEHHQDVLESITSGSSGGKRRQSANGSSRAPLSIQPCSPSCKTNRHSIYNEPLSALSEHSVLLRTASSPTGTGDGHHHYSAADANSKDGCSYKNKYEFLRRKLHRHQEPSYSSHGRCESGLDGPVQDGVEDGLSHLVHDSSSVGKKHAIVNTLVLQAGIMLHSLIIGLTLSIKSGPEYTSLVIAIAFHQLFEGLSLGVRLAALVFSSEQGRMLTTPIILAIIFALSVPAGCFVGHLTLGTTSSFGSPELKLPLTQGLTSAISAGTLIYASGVELLAGDFLHSSLRQSSVGRQVLALLSVTVSCLEANFICLDFTLTLHKTIERLIDSYRIYTSISLLVIILSISDISLSTQLQKYHIFVTPKSVYL
ncbi:hypothetical protein ACEPAI_1761 [Sanghuangporus weigelae]